LREGDVGFVYFTKESARAPNGIAAVLQVTSEGRVTERGEASDFYFYKVPFEVVFSLDSVIDFAALAPSLSFVKRKERYGVFLQGKSAIRLNQADVREIYAAIQKVIRPSQRRVLARRVHFEVQSDHASKLLT
jgi:hypothetical protein